MNVNQEFGSLDDVLSELELDQGTEEAKREVDDLEQSQMELRQLEKELSRRQETGKQLERNALQQLRDLQSDLEDWQEYKASDEFQFNKQENAHDHSAITDLEDIIEYYRDIVPNLVISTLLYKRLVDALEDKIDEQQALQDQAFVVQQIQEITKIHRETTQEQTKAFKDALNPVAERLSALEDVTEELKNHQSLRDEIATLEERVDQKDQQVERLQQQLDEQELTVEEAAQQHDLSDEEQTALALYRGGLSASDIAEHVTKSDSTIRDWKAKFKRLDLL